MFGFKQHAYAYKFIAFALFALAVAIIVHWASIIGLFGHGLIDTNIQDEYGDVCVYQQGPNDDFAGIEDLTLISNSIFYFAHPYRRLFANKEFLTEFIQHLGLDTKQITTVKQLLPLLPPQFREPKIYFTPLSTTNTLQSTTLLDIQQVPIEGFDLNLYHEFFPLGADSYTNPLTKQEYINVIYAHRNGHSVAQFEVIYKDIEIKKEIQRKTEHDGTTTATTQIIKEKSTTPTLILRHVYQNSLWASPNGIAMVSEKEFFITNFLSVSPLDDELSSVLELLLLRRRGAVLHCATDKNILPSSPQSFSLQGTRLNINPTPEIIHSKSSSSKSSSSKSNNNLYCYPFLTNLGQTNGIAVDLERSLLYITGGLSKQIITFELGTYDLLQFIPVPIGVDNLKIDNDTHNVYYGVNPSMIAIGKIISSPLERAPAAVYRLNAQAMQYDKNELAQRLANSQNGQENNDKTKNSNDEITIDKLSNDDNNDDNDDNNNNENNKELSWFYYVEPEPKTIYIDTNPIHKSTSPTALPIPSKYTTQSQQRLYVAGSIYDRGIDLCRIIV